MRENSSKMIFETSMSSISRGHVLAKVSHVGRITLPRQVCSTTSWIERNRRRMIWMTYLGFRFENVPKHHFHEKRGS